MKIRKIVGYILYHGFAKRLPKSFSNIKFGQMQIRALCGKLMLEECGKKVNIERNAEFSVRAKIGNYSGIGINARVRGACVIGDYVLMGPNCTIYSRKTLIFVRIS